MDKNTKFWNRIAKGYDTQVNEGDLSAIKILENIKQFVKPEDVVLDFACATGKFAFEIADWVKEIEGIDISPDMIVIAKENAEARGFQNVHFSTASLFDTRYAPGSFDVILAFNILHLLEDSEQAVARIYELLKAGGLFISVTACMGERGSLLRFILWPLSKLGFVPPLNFYRPADIENLITDGNFNIIDTEILPDETDNYFVVARKA